MNEKEDILNNGGLEGLKSYTIFKRKVPGVKRYNCENIKIIDRWHLKICKNNSTRIPYRYWFSVVGQMRDGSVIQSSPIIDTESPRVLITENIRYRLESNSDLRKIMPHVEFSREELNKFLNGFPKDWMNIFKSELEKIYGENLYNIDDVERIETNREIDKLYNDLETVKSKVDIKEEGEIISKGQEDSKKDMSRDSNKDISRDSNKDMSRDNSMEMSRDGIRLDNQQHIKRNERSYTAQDNVIQELFDMNKEEPYEDKRTHNRKNNIRNNDRGNKAPWKEYQHGSTSNVTYINRPRQQPGNKYGNRQNNQPQRRGVLHTRKTLSENKSLKVLTDLNDPFENILDELLVAQQDIEEFTRHELTRHELTQHGVHEKPKVSSVEWLPKNYQKETSKDDSKEVLTLNNVKKLLSNDSVQQMIDNKKTSKDAKEEVVNKDIDEILLMDLIPSDVLSADNQSQDVSRRLTFESGDSTKLKMNYDVGDIFEEIFRETSLMKTNEGKGDKEEIKKDDKEEKKQDVTEENKKIEKAGVLQESNLEKDVTEITNNPVKIKSKKVEIKNKHEEHKKDKLEEKKLSTKEDEKETQLETTSKEQIYIPDMSFHSLDLDSSRIYPNKNNLTYANTIETLPKKRRRDTKKEKDIVKNYIKDLDEEKEYVFEKRKKHERKDKAEDIKDTQDKVESKVGKKEIPRDKTGKHEKRKQLKDDGEKDNKDKEIKSSKDKESKVYEVIDTDEIKVYEVIDTDEIKVYEVIDTDEIKAYKEKDRAETRPSNDKDKDETKASKEKDKDETKASNDKESKIDKETLIQHNDPIEHDTSKDNKTSLSTPVQSSSINNQGFKLGTSSPTTFEEEEDIIPSSQVSISSVRSNRKTKRKAITMPKDFKIIARKLKEEDAVRRVRNKKKN